MNHPTARTQTTTHVVANLRTHLHAHSWDLPHLDVVMGDRGWGGAHHHALPEQRPHTDLDPISALLQLLDGARDLVPGEIDALAGALGIPREHLLAVPPARPAARRGVLARLVRRLVAA